MDTKVSTTATARLKRDYMRLLKDPVPYIKAAPTSMNILVWHYVVFGPENSPFEGGIYHGKLVFPREYPFKPPSFYMITPNGRFKLNEKLCLSISDFHPDQWNPSWSVSTILTGLLSFMLENTPTTGHMVSTDATKRRLALESLEFNLKDKTFCELFPDVVAQVEEKLKMRNNCTDPEYQVIANDKHSKDTKRNENKKSDGTIANIVVFLIVLSFGLVVNYVFSTMK